MTKIFSITTSVVLVVVIGFLLFGNAHSENNQDFMSESNVEIVDGVQIIEIVAKAGYSPKQTKAKANIPTKLVVKTSGTFDCSLDLVIRSIGYKKMLAQFGEETIDLGVPKNGKLQGMCSMGMYSFNVDFE